MSRLIEDLAPEFQWMVTRFSEKLRTSDFPYVILETRRSQERQNALYAQGRESYDEVMRLRGLADLGGISAEDAATIVTWTRKSKHIDGYAVDIGVLRPNGEVAWNVNNPTIAAQWLSLGEIGEECGLIWGGRWEPLDKWQLGRDLPHFEMPPKG